MAGYIIIIERGELRKLNVSCNIGWVQGAKRLTKLFIAINGIQ